MRHTSWQDGVLGTNCPIQSGLNWTYNFQVKDQIGSFFYFPSLNFQRASGGFGSFVITNRKVISLPFNMPDGDIVILMGDWYTRSHTVGDWYCFIHVKCISFSFSLYLPKFSFLNIGPEGIP